MAAQPRPNGLLSYFARAATTSSGDAPAVPKRSMLGPKTGSPAALPAPISSPTAQPSPTSKKRQRAREDTKSCYEAGRPVPRAADFALLDAPLPPPRILASS